jgi:hypothetical protein
MPYSNKGIKMFFAINYEVKSKNGICGPEFYKEISAVVSCGVQTYQYWERVVAWGGNKKSNEHAVYVGY